MLAEQVVGVGLGLERIGSAFGSLHGESVVRLSILTALAPCNGGNAEVSARQVFSDRGCRVCALSVSAVSDWSELVCDDPTKIRNPISCT